MNFPACRPFSSNTYKQPKSIQVAGLRYINNKRSPCLNSVLIANVVIKICHLNQKRHTSVHSNAHFASIAWPNGLTTSARTAEWNWCDVQYASKHPSCVTLHPVSVTINSRDENYVHSLLITTFVILLAVRSVPGADELTELLFKGTVLSKNIDMPIQYEQTILATRGKKSNVATAKILEYNG